MSYVYKLSNGKKLTKNEFLNYFENKVFKTIRRYDLLDLDDKVCVALSGGKDSSVLLYLLYKYMKKKNLEKNLFALLIDEGIIGYRDKTIVFAKSFCEKLGIKIYIKEYKKNFGKSQDENVSILKKKGLNISPCNICGTFRRYLLNKFSREFGATKIATGHNTDDESQNILLNIFKNNFDVIKRLGPISEKISNVDFVVKIKPLYFCLEKEVKLYSLLKNFDMGYDECPYSRGSFRDDISNFLNETEDNRSGIKHSILNFYLELKDNLIREEKENPISTKCSKCSEPSKKKICNACIMKDLVN